MRPPRVLLAEDAEEMRWLLAGLLERAGYEVVQVEDGGALLQELARQLREEEPRGYDLVVTDIRMPGPTGLRVLERVRAGDSQTPFLLITAFGDDRTHAEAFRLGAPVLDKPFRPSAFLSLVRELVSPRRYDEGWPSPVA